LAIEAAVAVGLDGDLGVGAELMTSGPRSSCNPTQLQISPLKEDVTLPSLHDTD